MAPWTHVVFLHRKALLVSKYRGSPEFCQETTRMTRSWRFVTSYFLIALTLDLAISPVEAYL